MKVRLTVLAKADMLAQIDWLAKRSPQAARRARSVLLERLAGLTEFPLAAALVDDDHREAVVRFGRDGYIIRYRAFEDVVLVTRIFHARQTR